jgi:hypothetical protein
MNARPLCQKCRIRPCAVNYHSDEVVHYRSQCERCWRQKKQLAYSKPLWQLRGYQKKNRCDRCGFSSTVSQAFAVYSVDGDLKNTAPNNLRTVCANCQIILSVSAEGWRNAELVSDF